MPELTYELNVGITGRTLLRHFLCPYNNLFVHCYLLEKNLIRHCNSYDLLPKQVSAIMKRSVIVLKEQLQK